MSDTRPRGGRRPEDFPEAMELDRRVLGALRSIKPETGWTRNDLSRHLGADRRRVRYSLNRLRARGLVVHIPKGNEGHGYWAVAEKENETDGP